MKSKHAYFWEERQTSVVITGMQPGQLKTSLSRQPWPISPGERTESSTQQQTHTTMPTTSLEWTAFHPKPKKTAFQILDCTTWTNNKADKSGTRDNPYCNYCGQIETIEHQSTTVRNALPHSGKNWDTVSRLPLQHTSGTKYQQSNSPLLRLPTTKPTHPSNYNAKKN